MKREKGSVQKESLDSFITYILYRTIYLSVIQIIISKKRKKYSLPALLLSDQ